MKRLLTLCLGVILLGAFESFSQINENFNYQAVVRNADGSLVEEKSVGVKVEILEDKESTAAIYEETHVVQTNSYGIINLVIGSGNTSGVFADIDWGQSDKFLKVGIDIEGGANYTDIGVVKLESVPYSNFANKAKTAETLGSSNVHTTNSDTLFVVKDHLGRPVFAVFPDGAKVIVDQTAKGSIGGFAVSGRTTGKATDENIFTVTPDSTRIYVKNGGIKGAIGGFAVSGRTSGKAGAVEILTVNSDSTRVYISETAKGSIGGFAVSGRTTGKAAASDYFNVSGSGSASVDKINPSEARMLWYPKSEAFLVGRVLVEDADSVGLNSMATGFESKAVGDYSQALGYSSIARGDYSTAIGRGAIAKNTNSFAFGNGAVAYGNNSLAFGESAEAFSSESYSFGRGAKSYGYRSFAFGSSGVDSSGVATGVTQAKGDYSFAIGQGSITGIDLEDCPPKPLKFPGTQEDYWKIYYSGEGAVAIGVGDSSLASYATTIGYYNTASYGSVALGYQNKAYGLQSAILGGYSNKVYSSSAVIAGGHGHRIEASYAGILGGVQNKIHADAPWGVIGGGYRNEVFGSTATVVNGTYNVATGTLSTVMGSRNNAISWAETVVGRYNAYKAAGNPDEWIATDDLFVIGNGTAEGSRSNAMTVLKNGRTGIGTIYPNSRLHVNSSSGEVGLRVQIAGSSKLIVNSNGGVSIGTTIAAAANSLYVAGDVSGLSITDRTPYPKDLKTAYDAVQSMKRLPEGDYQEDNKEYQLDHSTLHPFVTSSDGEHRDLSATVSAQNEVIKDLIKQNEELKEQLEKQNKDLQDRIKKLEELILNK